MAIPRILHMLVPGDNVSPFDVNMAVDAGFEVIVPYTGIGTDRVVAMVQDAIFSRPPKRFRETGIFIGGWDVNEAAEMLSQTRGAMVPPFEVSVFADPNGAYSTAAAMIAMAEAELITRDGRGFEDRKTVIFGGGPVGMCAAVLVAQENGKPMLARLTPAKPEREAAATGFFERYGVNIPWVSAQSDDGKRSALESAEVVIAAAKAGIRIITDDMLQDAKQMKVAVDVNAVPPSGIEGIGPRDADVALAGGAVGIGALAVGDIKYKVQSDLLKYMQQAEQAVVLDFPDAFRRARELL
ncbi:MAG: NAD(P)-dependent methylenetetrahydromethanopterin dehydrogenase [Pseudomonadota bacterium]